MGPGDVHLFILSLIIQSITTTCVRWHVEHRDSASEYVRGVHVFVCMGMHVWSGEGWRSRLLGED